MASAMNRLPKSSTYPLTTLKPLCMMAKISFPNIKEDMMSELRELMQEAPDEETRKEFKRFMSKLSDM